MRGQEIYHSSPSEREFSQPITTILPEVQENRHIIYVYILYTYTYTNTYTYTYITYVYILRTHYGICNIRFQGPNSGVFNQNKKLT